jgi:Ca2+/Na+ antiporter
MVLFTLLLIAVGFARRGRIGKVNRWEGVTLVLLYAGYVTALGITL